MARFFGRNKNQAEMDFRRFEQEIYINSTQRPSPSSAQEHEDYDQGYDSPSLSLRPSHSQTPYEQREPQHFLRQEPSEPRSSPLPHPLRSDPEFRHSQRIPSHENELYHFAPQQNYRPQDYRQASRQDELKGLGFWQEEEDFSSEDAEEWVERPSPLKFIIALLGLTLMMSIVWFGYHWLSQPSSEGPPLLEAEPGPFKVKPDKPGGSAIPYQDKLIYGRISPEAEAPVERLLPPPEQADVSPPPAAGTNQQAYGQPSPQQHPPQDYQQHPHYPPQAPVHQGQGVVLPQGSSSVAPQVSVQQQQTYYPGQGGGYPAQPSSQAPMPAGNPPYSPPLPGGSFSQQPANSAPVPLQPSVPYPPPYPPPPPPGGGAPYPPPPYTGQAAYHQHPSNAYAFAVEGVHNPSLHHRSEAVHEELQTRSSQALPIAKPALYIQLGTLPTEESAKQELSRLRKKYYPEIGDLGGCVRSFEAQDGKKNFRVLIGPFKSRNMALSKCSKLGSTCRVLQLP